MTSEDEDDQSLWAFFKFVMMGSFILYQKCLPAESSTPAVLRLPMARALLGERLANASVCTCAQLLLWGTEEPRESLLEGLLASVSDGAKEPRG